MPIMPLSFICLDLRVQVGIPDFSFAIRSETIQHPWNHLPDSRLIKSKVRQ